MRSSAFLPLLTISICACIGLTSCSKNDKEVSFTSGGMTHTFAEGKETKLKDFALPIYPNAQPTGSVTAQGADDENSSFMMLSSADSLSQVSDFYTQKLKEDGWTVNATTTMPKMVNISASRKNMEANVMVGLDSEKTTITLAVSKELQGVPKVSDEQYTPDKLNPPTD